MKVIHINNNLFDIFFNIGWDNWARFAIRGNKAVQVAGVEVPSNIQHFLAKRYNK